MLHPDTAGVKERAQTEGKKQQLDAAHSSIKSKDKKQRCGRSPLVSRGGRGFQGGQRTTSMPAKVADRPPQHKVTGDGGIRKKPKRNEDIKLSPGGKTHD